MCVGGGGSQCAVAVKRYGERAPVGKWRYLSSANKLTWRTRCCLPRRRRRRQPSLVLCWDLTLYNSINALGQLVD